jgi:hypothetical protein
VLGSRLHLSEFLEFIERFGFLLILILFLVCWFIFVVVVVGVCLFCFGFLLFIHSFIYLGFFCGVGSFFGVSEELL